MLVGQLATLILRLVLERAPRWRRRPIGFGLSLVPGFVALALGSGVSRLCLGVHFVTDVVAGYLVGSFRVSACIIGVRLLVGSPGVRRGRAASRVDGGAASALPPVRVPSSVTLRHTHC